MSGDRYPPKITNALLTILEPHPNSSSSPVDRARFRVIFLFILMIIKEKCGKMSASTGVNIAET
jgi:hypothetical protein